MDTSLVPSAFSLMKTSRNLSSQFESGSVATVPDNATIGDLPLAVWRNRRYVLQKSLSRKGSKGRKSWIKLHGLFVVELDVNDKPLNAHWVCRLCDIKGQAVFFAASATTSAADHLRKVFEGSPVADSDPSTDESDRAKRPRLHYSAVPKARINIVRELSVGLIVDADCPSLSSRIHTLSNSSGSSIPKLLSVVEQELSHALTKIHLGFDLWTSPNRYAIMAVTAHFLDRQGCHQMRLLALRRQLGCHSGENLACTLLEVVREWGLEDRVGVVVSDNAATNDTCLQNFYPNLDSSMKAADVRARRMRCYGHVLNLVARAFLYGEDYEAFEAESQVLDLLSRQEEELRHWRKKGPVGKLHNIVKFVRSSPQRSELFKRVARENDETQGFQLAFESTAELEVMMDNNTRWNSTYLMISRAFVKQNDLRAFLVHPNVEGSLPQEDILSADDWRLLGEVKHILEPFYLQTMRTQGWGRGDGNGRLWEVLTGVEYLLEHLEDWKLFYNDVTDDTIRDSIEQVDETAQERPSRSRQRPARFNDCEVDLPSQRPQERVMPEHVSGTYTRPGRPAGVSAVADIGDDHRRYLRLCIMNAWQKLNEYYTKLGDSPLFAASIILHPGLGIRYLEINWATEEQLVWVRDAKTGLSRYIDKWYRPSVLQGSCEASTRGPAPMQSVAPDKPHEASDFKQWVMSRTSRATAAGSELDRYMRLESQETKDPVRWWMAHQESFPVLSKLALDVFAIPAMATDCERSFSLAKLSLTSQRLSMSSTTLEALQCLKNWTRHGAVKLGSARLGRGDSDGVCDVVNLSSI
ncbi:hypothetical protein MY4038_009655 [Beauveria bassiana]